MRILRWQGCSMYGRTVCKSCCVWFRKGPSCRRSDNTLLTPCLQIPLARWRERGEGRGFVIHAAICKFVCCLSWSRRNTTSCCGRAISTLCAARIHVCGRSGRASRLSGRYIRSTTKCTGKSCRLFWICTASRLLLGQHRPCSTCGKPGTAAGVRSQMPLRQSL